MAKRIIQPIFILFGKNGAKIYNKMYCSKRSKNEREMAKPTVLKNI